MKVFLTGGTGFIGSHILMKLLKDGHNTTVLAQNKNKITTLCDLKNVVIIEGSIGDYKLVEKSIVDHDVCIHVALFWGEHGAYRMLENDTASSIFLANVAAEAGCKHFIYTSSTAVNDYFYMVPENVREDKSTLIPVHYRHTPVTYYGATKAATENYLHAISYETEMMVNIVRPGYTFGNPAVPGAPVQSDTRFKNIALKAKYGENIEIIKHDGTQFIWADDLAEVYIQLLQKKVTRKTYFALSKDFIAWQYVAEQAIKLAGSKSKIIIPDNEYSKQPVLFDVSGIKDDFGLEFNPREKIINHIKYYQEND